MLLLLLCYFSMLVKTLPRTYQLPNIGTFVLACFCLISDLVDPSHLFEPASVPLVFSLLFYSLTRQVFADGLLLI